MAAVGTRAEIDARTELVVALFGRSLLLAGVTSRLGREANLRVVVIDGPALTGALGDLAPNVLIVDLAVVPIEAAVALLRDHPDLLLVGLEADGARLIVLSGERAGSVGTDDLIALIECGLTGRIRTGNCIASSGGRSGPDQIRPARQPGAARRGV